MTVAITGMLSEPRAMIAAKINATANARFVERVAFDTDFLIAARLDTGKAKAAVVNGTLILSESQLDEYLRAGEFPWHERKSRVSNGAGFHVSDIVWKEKLPEASRCRIQYADQQGELIDMEVTVIFPLGIHPNGHEYVGAYSDGGFKTFRKDKVIRLERMEE
jgi:hypothetical protein